MCTYDAMSRSEAAAALEEFLEERPRALRWLAEALAEDGEDPGAVLDGTTASLTPLWRWVKSRLTCRDDAGQEAPPAGPGLPSWLRYGKGHEATLSAESLKIVDGLTSYFCQVVASAAPEAVWGVGHDRAKRYAFENRPVLRRGKDEVGMTNYVAFRARGHLDGMPIPDDELTGIAAALVERFGRGPDRIAAGNAGEPLVEVDELDGGSYDFEMSVRDDIANEQPGLVDRMVEALENEPGVAEALREDRERVLVRAPDWSDERVAAWATSYLAASLAG